MYVSNRLDILKPSATLAVTAKAKELQKAGQDIIVLAAGEPDFGPPQAVRERAAREALEGQTSYGLAAGSLEVREALSAHLEHMRGIHYSPAEIIFSNGAKQALYNAMVALLDPGDEAVILAPYWVTYTAQVQLAGGKPLIVECESSTGFKVTPDKLREVLTGKPRCLLINNPCNPTGAFYTPDEIRLLTEICVEAECSIVSDEVYDTIIFEETPYLSPAGVSDDARELTAVIGSLSKTYAMPGWRIGYMIGPEEWIKKVAAYQGQTTSHPSALAQAAAIAAFTGDQGIIEEGLQTFRKRRDFILDAIASIPGFHIEVPPQGAFYLFPDVTDLIEAIPGAKGSVDVCTWLLEEARVALVPGAAFGAEGFLRISYAASMENLEKAVQWIGEAVRKLEF